MAKRKPVEEHWAAAQSRAAGKLRAAATGQSKVDGPHDLWPQTRDTLATVALVHAVLGLGWQLDGIRRALDMADIGQDEVEFLRRVHSAHLTVDWQKAFDYLHTQANIALDATDKVVYIEIPTVNPTLVGDLQKGPDEG